MQQHAKDMHVSTDTPHNLQRPEKCLDVSPEYFLDYLEFCK